MNRIAARLSAARRLNAECAVSLSKRRAWYDAEEGGGTQTTDTDTPADSASNSGAGGNGGQQTATLTQEQANKLIGDARKKGREAAVADLLKELGFDKADDLKALVTSAKERADAEKSEAQKAAEAKEAAEKRATELEATLNAERQAARLERRDNAIKDALRTAGVTDDKDNPRLSRVMVLLKSERASDVEVLQDADGKVDEAKLKKLVDDATKAYPEYFKAAPRYPGTGSHSGGRAVEPGKEAQERARQQVAQRQRSGW